jgi:putative oxidoreductase
METLNKFAPNAHWLLRLALVGPFAYHGLGKLLNAAGSAQMMQMPIALVVMLGVIEVGGVAILLAGPLAKDWMVRLTGVGFAGIMIGAIVMVHAAHGWNSLGNMGMEFQVTLTLVSLYFVIVGNQAGRNKTRV